MPPASSARPVLLAGATGAVGSALAEVLLERGWRLRCTSRSPDRARERWPDRDWVALDVDDPATLAPALDGCGAAVYLVHGMADGGDYVARERAAAGAFARAAEAAGLDRIVYLGGVRPDGEPSRHLLSRLETGRILRTGAVECLELRAGMVIGPGSESWRIVRDLAMRLPLQLLPAWLQSRSQPIALADVCVALAEGLSLDLPGGSRWLDAPGPETLSAAEILRRVGKVAGMEPVQMQVPVMTPGLSSHWLRLVTRADPAVARELVHGLTHDLVSNDDGIWRLLPDHQRLSFDEAARVALEAEAGTLRRRDRVLEQAILRMARLAGR